LSITTNGFWLNKKNLYRLRELFLLLDRIVVSIFPTYYKKINNSIYINKLEQVIRDMYPHLVAIEIRNKYQEGHFQFTNWESLPIEGEAVPRCCQDNCTTLLADGRLARCSTGGYGSIFNERLAFFNDSKEMFFDLTKSSDNLSEWLYRWPLDVCRVCPFCSPLRGKWQPERGLDMKVRRAYGKQALDKIRRMPL
jgi:hypothetical protein